MTSAPDFTAAVNLAIRYMDARNYRRAEEVLHEALVHNPHHPRLLTELARAQHLRGDHKAAEPSVRRALAYAPHDAYPMRICASILIELGRRREGLEMARRAVDAAPFDQVTHYEYARLLVQADQPADALPVATEALRMVPDDADAHVLMGVVLGKLGRRAESTAEYEKALQLQPGHAQATANIAVNRAAGRNFAGAFAGFTQAGALDPHLGDQIRRNITAIVRMWLSWTTLAAWAALYIIVRIQEFSDTPGPAARIVAGIGAVVLLVMLGWFARSLPRSLWGPTFRRREFRSLKIYLSLAVLVLIVMGAYALGAPFNYWVLVGTLLITVVVSWVAPRLDKDRIDRAKRKSTDASN